MAKLLKLRRGTTTQHGSFTGAEGEVTIDTTKDTAVVHDGAQAGGRPLLREDMSNLPAGTIDNADINTSAAIAGTKISPNFGTQDLVTTGNIDISDSTGAGNNRIKIGTGDDLQIYHDGNFSRIVDGGTGDLVVHSNTIAFRDAGDSENLARFHENGSNELYYDNTKRFETISDGAKVTGRLQVTNYLEFDDGVEAYWGNSHDLEIYHDGSNSAINDTGAGNLYIQGSNNIYLRDYDTSENHIVMTKDGSVDLYYNNSKKLETTTNGVTVTGSLSTTGNVTPTGYIKLTDNQPIYLGTGNDLSLSHDGTDNFIDSTGKLYIKASTFVDIRGSNNETMIKATPDAAVELFYDNSKTLETTSYGAKITGNAEFRKDSTTTDFTTLSAPGANDSGCYVQNVGATTGNFAAFSAIAHSANSVGMSASFIAKSHATGYSPEVYITQRDGSNSQRTAIKVTNPGAVELNHAGTKKLETDSNGIKFNDDFYVLDSNKGYFGTGNDLSLYHNGSNSFIENTTGKIMIQNTSGNIQFEAKNGEDSCKMIPDGAVELYYDNAKKFETTTTGFKVPGNCDIRGDHGNWTGEAAGKIQWHSNHMYLQTASNWIFRSQNGTERAYLDSNGNFVATGNVTAYSDARLKTDIHTINDALGICGKLRGVSYKWLENGKASIGVIAQEVEEVIPEVVLTNVNTDPVTGIEKEVKSVDYGKIVGVLINAINELKAEVDELKGGK